MKGWVDMQKANKQSAQTPITLKDWVYDLDGEEISELIKTSFLEFYFAKKTVEKCQNA
jgi:hypothetical protein